MKTIRKILFFSAAAILLCSCGALSPASKAARAAEKEAERAAFVNALENCDFILEVTTIIPRGFPSKTSTAEYRLRLDGDVVTTRLPFIGESREAVYGGTDEISIVFDKEKVQVMKDFSDSAKGEYRYQFQGGKGPGKWIITLQIYDNGNASIGAAGSGGKYMSYFANLILPDKDKKNENNQ